MATALHAGNHMPIHRILCPLCFTDRAEPSMREAVRLAKLEHAELVLLDSWYVPPVAFAGDIGWLPPDAIEEMVDKKEIELGLAVRQCKQAGVDRVTSRMLSGAPSDQVLTTLEHGGFDLVVLPVDDARLGGGFKLGALAKRVFDHAPCSVLVTAPSAGKEPFRNVLCPVDFSENSLAAVDLACELVDKRGAITLMHVTTQSLADLGSDRERLHHDEDAAIAELEQWAADIRARVPVSVAIVSRVGQPSTEILEMFGAGGYDLIVLGTHPHPGLRSRLFGSVASRIIRHATCPVLFAHLREESTPTLRAIR
jgi:nucleotide-binding universal stress UspA family protein